jgi:tRNA modification GTPase
MALEANRAALLTPPGAAAIAVVRLAGPGVAFFLGRHFSKPVQARRCVHGTLFDGDRVIDDPVVVLTDLGAADINLHGGEWVVRECLELARREGFDVLDSADELIDSDDEIEREMLEALPMARTEQALRLLLVQPQQWALRVNKPDLRVRVADTNDPELKVRLARIEQILTDKSLWWMLHPPTVAIVGIPNVGKSTIANCLFGQQRSITADVPGTTRDWVGDWANIDGLPVHLLDTPGQRASSDSIEQAAIASSHEQIDRADLVILVLDPTQPSEAQKDVLARYPRAIEVINKTDLQASWDAPSIGGIHMVATTGFGVDKLRMAIRARFDCTDMSIDRPRWWTQRQREMLQRIRTAD